MINRNILKDSDLSNTAERTVSRYSKRTRSAPYARNYHECRPLRNFPSRLVIVVSWIRRVDGHRAGFADRSGGHQTVRRDRLGGRSTSLAAARHPCRARGESGAAV